MPDEAFVQVVIPVSRGDHGFSAETEERRCGIYQSGHHVGRSLIQVWKNGEGFLAGGDAEVFDKWSQPLATPADQARLLPLAVMNVPRLRLAALLPVLVVPDGVLWEANYADDGRTSPSLISGEAPGHVHQVHETTFFVNRDYEASSTVRLSVSHMHIMTKSGYESSLQSLGGRAWKLFFNHEGPR